MASFKFNVARIRGCPPPAELAAALEEYGLPETEEFGVLHHAAAPQSVSAAVVRKTRQVVQQLDAEARQVTAGAVEKATVYPFTVHPARERLEVYAGAAKAIEDLGAFFSGSLALPTVTEAIELDVLGAIQALLAETRKPQLCAARIGEYAHDSFLSGPYAPKFLDTQHGLDFLERYPEGIASARIRFQANAGRATITLTPKACFTYSCNEEDQPEVQMILRKLI